MEGIWLVSYILLWVIVLVLAVVCLALVRLLDQMARRLAARPAQSTTAQNRLDSAAPEGYAPADPFPGPRAP